MADIKTNLSSEEIREVEIAHAEKMHQQEIAEREAKERIDKLKKEHGKKLTQITTSDENGDEVVFVFKKPNMAIMSAVAKLSQSNPMQAAIIFAENTLVEGDPALFEDVDIFNSISEHIMNLVEQRKVQVKNL